MQSGSSNGSFELEAPANSYLPFTVNRRASPVLALPPEITSEIFFQFLPDPPDLPPLSGPTSPLQLCQICRQWSAIALSIPRLWSMVRIVMSKNRKASAQVELFKTWLSRSGDSPLSISLRSFSGTYVLSHFLQSQFAIFSPRLEYLDLAIPCDAMYMVRSHMPLLRHLELTLTSIPFWGLDALTPFDRSPLLTHIVLERFYNQFILQLPWTQFTHLEVQYLTLAECAEILCDAIRLVHCTFGIRPSDQRMDIPLVPPHDRLQHLVLRPGLNQSQDRDLWRLFDRLTLPALRTLEVFDFGLNPDSLEAFISRSRCSLHQLHVTEGNGMLSEILDDERLPSVGRDVLEGSGLEVYS